MSRKAEGASSCCWTSSICSDPDWTWERVNAARQKPPADTNGADLIPRIILPEEWKRKIYHDNAAELYGLD